MLICNTTSCAGRTDLEDLIKALISLKPYYVKYGYIDKNDWRGDIWIPNDMKNGKMDEALSIPKEDLPLYLNEKDKYKRMIIDWRLHHGC